MGKITGFLRFLSFLFVLLMGGNAFAAGYSCLYKYTSCPEGSFLSDCSAPYTGQQITNPSYGNYCNTSCPNGMACVGGNTCPAANSVSCSVGYYKGTNNACKPCESGYYCPGGTYAASASIAGRNACPSGTDTAAVFTYYEAGKGPVSNPQASSASECYLSAANGDFWVWETDNYNGFWRPHVASTKCFYNTGDSRYNNCNGNRYFSEVAAGYFADTTGAQTSVSGTGNFVNRITACPRGTYSTKNSTITHGTTSIDWTYARSCTECPENTTTAGTGTAFNGSVAQTCNVAVYTITLEKSANNNSSYRVAGTVTGGSGFTDLSSNAATATDTAPVTFKCTAGQSVTLPIFKPNNKSTYTWGGWSSSNTGYVGTLTFTCNSNKTFYAYNKVNQTLVKGRNGTYKVSGKLSATTTDNPALPAAITESDNNNNNKTVICYYGLQYTPTFTPADSRISNSSSWVSTANSTATGGAITCSTAKYYALMDVWPTLHHSITGDVLGQVPSGTFTNAYITAYPSDTTETTWYRCYQGLGMGLPSFTPVSRSGVEFAGWSTSTTSMVTPSICGQDLDWYAWLTTDVYLMAQNKDGNPVAGTFATATSTNSNAIVSQTSVPGSDDSATLKCYVGLPITLGAFTPADTNLYYFHGWQDAPEICAPGAGAVTDLWNVNKLHLGPDNAHDALVTGTPTITGSNLSIISNQNGVVTLACNGNYSFSKNTLELPGYSLSPMWYYGRSVGCYGPGTDVYVSGWSPDTYTITLDDGTGATGGSGTLYEYYENYWFDESGEITSCKIPTKTGWTFAGYASGDGTRVFDADCNLGAPTRFVADTTLYALWTKNKYTVTLEKSANNDTAYRVAGKVTGGNNVSGLSSNAATITDTAPVTFKCSYGDTVTLPTFNPSQTSVYTFVRWSNTSGKYSSATTFTCDGDKKYYAVNGVKQTLVKGRNNTYKVSGKLGYGGSVTDNPGLVLGSLSEATNSVTNKTVSCYYGLSYKPTFTPADSHFEMRGWMNTENAKTNTVKTVVVCSADTLYAQMDVKPVFVKGLYTSAPVSGKVTGQYLTSADIVNETSNNTNNFNQYSCWQGLSADLPTFTPENSAYTFHGWSATAGGGATLPTPQQGVTSAVCGDTLAWYGLVTANKQLTSTVAGTFANATGDNGAIISQTTAADNKTRTVNCYVGASLNLGAFTPADTNSYYFNGWNGGVSHQCDSTAVTANIWNVNKINLGSGTTGNAAVSGANVVRLSQTNNVLTVACNPGTSYQLDRSGLARTGYVTNAHSSGNLSCSSAGDVYDLIWEPIQYGVKYNINKPSSAPACVTGSGTMADSYFMYDGSDQMLSTNAYSLTGYSFTGWNTAANGTGTRYADGQTIGNLASVAGATVNLYAQWTPIEYSITYNLDGGTNAASNSQKYTVASTPITLANPTKAKHTFDAWYSDSAFGTKVNAPQIPACSTGNKTFYVKFNPNNISATVTNKTTDAYDGTNKNCNAVISGLVPSDATVTFSETNGSGYVANITKKDAGTYTLYYKISKDNYYDKTGSYTCTIPKNSNCTITVKDGANTVDATHPVTLTFPTAKTLTVSSSCGDAVTLVSKGTSYVTVSGSTLTPVAVTSSGVDIEATTAGSNNYNAAPKVTFKAKVDAGQIVVPVPGKKTKVYDGTALTCGPVSVTSPSGTTIKYRTTASGDYTLTDAPQITNVNDSKTVYYQVTKSNYQTVTGSFECEITQASCTLALSKSSDEITWGGTLNPVTVTSSCPGAISKTNSDDAVATAEYSSATKKITMTPNKAGTTVVTVSAAHNNNYADVAPVTYTLKINKADCTITVKDGATTLDATHPVTLTFPTAKTLTATTTGDGTVSLSRASADSAYLSASGMTLTPLKKTGNNVTITAQANATDRYNACSVTFPAQVKPGKPTLTITPDSSSVTYPYSETKSFTVSYNGNATIGAPVSSNANVATATLNNGTLTVTYKNVGTADITLTAPATDQYESASATHTVTVGSGNMADPTVGTVKLAYNGNSQSCAPVVTNAPAGASYTYSSSENGTYSATAPSMTNGGSQNLWIKISAPNYVDKKLSYVCTMNQVTLSETSGTITYPATTRTFTVTKNQGGGQLSVVSDNTNVATASISGTTVTVTFKNAGNAKITVTGAEKGNYIAASAEYSVTTVNGTITGPGDKTLYYNGNAQSCANTAGMVPSNATIKYSTTQGNYGATAPTLTNAGSTTVYYQITADHYTTLTGSYTCTMNSVSVTYNANMGTGTCNPTVCTNATTCNARAWDNANCKLANGAKVLTGWNTKADGSGTSYAFNANIDAVAVAADKQLYAVWATPECTVTHGSGTAVTAVDNKATCAVTCDTGYKTSGTYSSSVSGTTAFTYTCNPISYTVVYNKNDSAATGTMANSSRTYDDGVALTSNGFSNSGYVFAGWATSSDGAVVYANGATDNLTSTDGAVINLYAKWTSNGYTVTYSCGTGATGTVAPETATYNNTFTPNMAPNCKRAGYTFSGWNDGTQNWTTGAKWTYTTGKTFTAQWAICPAGSYCDGSAYNAKVACNTLGGKLYVNSAQGSVNSSACYVSVPAGSYLSAPTATSLSTCEQGYKCPAGDVYYNGTGNRAACSVATQYQNETGQSTCKTVGSGYYKVDNTAQAQCTGATYCENAVKKNCPDGYSANTTAGKTAANQCQISCAGGSYVETSGGGCVNVGAGYWRAAHTVNYGATDTKTSCDVDWPNKGLTTIGYGAGADEKGDCGRILHVTNGQLYLRNAKKTTPSLNIKMRVGDDSVMTLYGNMSQANKVMSNGQTKKLKVKKGTVVYSVSDDSVN